MVRRLLYSTVKVKMNLLLKKSLQLVACMWHRLGNSAYYEAQLLALCVRLAQDILGISGWLFIDVYLCVLHLLLLDQPFILWINILFCGGSLSTTSYLPEMMTTLLFPPYSNITLVSGGLIWPEAFGAETQGLSSS